ncbi:hypothetical protein BBK36DRAFT_1157124 [Trichoderma citrinoviride]|uniref:Uncharacterized protein n=1 Tax=Trichoderma citrinoviride TaxID=58853 RepID=A0A2T4BHT1_9HYPO|nr:hypothetical protein BBK36DRAFT_1157124 [Trichoderma citrinoviride]PTB68884.1 hypothetical protein BBK36DRAFT_1157124 [Trichoderma citrinoviride]
MDATSSTCHGIPPPQSLTMSSLPEFQPHHHAHPPTSFDQQQQQQAYIETQLHPGDLAGTIDPLLLFGPRAGQGHVVVAAVALQQPNVSSSSSSAPADASRVTEVE